MLSFLAIHAVSLVGVALALAVIGHILRGRSSPPATIAWLVGILAFPYLGIPLYLALGTRKLGSSQHAKPHIDLATLAPLAEPFPIDELLQSQGVPAASRGNRVELHADGVVTYQALIARIEEARASLWLEIFILHPDAVGRAVRDRLAERAADGLEVRVLLDAIGSFTTRRRFLAPICEAGGQVEFFNPLLHRPFRGRSNLRNHRKLLIADGSRVVAGGTNIAAEYLGPDPDPARWRDLCFSLDGPAVAPYCEIFASDWLFATKQTLAVAAELRPLGSAGNAIAQVVPSGPDVPRDPLYSALLSAVFAAKRRVWAVTPYFVPNDALAQALVLAARRGVEVRVIVPSRSNHRLADIARGAPLRDLQEAGGHVELFGPGMVHAKAVVIDDDFGMLGSANLDMRSLFFNYEVALLVFGKAETAAIEAWVEELALGCREGLPSAGAMRELAEGALRVIAPLL